MCSLKLSKSEAVFVNAEKFILGISIVFQDIGYSEITRPDEISPKLSVLSQKTQVIVLNWIEMTQINCQISCDTPRYKTHASLNTLNEIDFLSVFSLIEDI